MNPNQYWEDRASHLIGSVRGALGKHAPVIFEDRANALIAAVVEAFPDRSPLDVLEDPAASQLLEAYLPGHYDGGRDAETVRYSALRLLRRYRARRRR